MAGAGVSDDGQGALWPELEEPKVLTVPEVRRELFALGLALGSDRLRYLAAQLVRRSAVRRAPPSARRATPRLRAEIRGFAEAHPELTEFQIGEAFQVNQGRVSEALAGFRGKPEPASPAELL